VIPWVVQVHAIADQLHPVSKRDWMIVLAGIVPDKIHDLPISAADHPGRPLDLDTECTTNA